MQGVKGLGIRVWGLGFTDLWFEGLGFRGLGFGGLRFRVWGEYRVWCLEPKVELGCSLQSQQWCRKMEVFLSMPHWGNIDIQTCMVLIGFSYNESCNHFRL